jgi:hypothetical protein
VQLSSLEAFLTRENSGRTTIFLASGKEILGASGRKHWRAKGMADEPRDEAMDGGDDAGDEAALSK